MTQTPGGIGHNPLVAEATRAHAEPAGGFRHDWRIPLNGWKTSVGAHVGTLASGIAGWTAIDTNLMSLAWHATASASDIIMYAWEVPYDFANAARDLEIWMRFAKTGSGTNADLAMEFTFAWMNPGQTAASTLISTIDDVVLPAAVADNNPERHLWYRRDIYEKVAAGADIKAGALCRLRINPNETVGTDLQVDFSGAFLRGRRHLGMLPYAWRDADKIGTTLLPDGVGAE